MAAGKSIPRMAVEAASSADHGAGHGHHGSSGGGGGHGSGGGGGGYETPNAGYMWLGMCFLGIMASFIVYGIVMEYATSGGRELHELSMIFLTSLMYSVTAYYCRRVNREEPTTIPKTQMLVLGMTSMGSTFTSVRSLRYVIYPVQVLGKSCKPIPVMLMGAFLGKKYPLKKYLNVGLIVAGVALFMHSGSGAGKPGGDSGSQLFGLTLLFMSLCFDGGTGAYEDKLMCKHHVGAFDLMFNIQFAKMLLAGLGLVITGQINGFFSSGRRYVYDAAKAANQATFHQHMEAVKKINERAYMKLIHTPHAEWANYAGRGNVTWDQTTSNMAESLNNMIGAAARSKTVLGFLQDIVLQTGKRLHESAELKKGDTAALITPYATAIFNAEFKHADRLAVSPTGSGGYMVFPQQDSFQSNRANLRWGESSDHHVYDCSCRWCLRWKMPCRHVLAAAKASNTAHKALELVDKGYSLATYRAAAADPNYLIVPPVCATLTPNTEHLPPLMVNRPAGRPKKGPRKRKRIESNGEHNTSARTYAMQNAEARRTGSASAAGSGGGGSAGGAAGVVGLSQGVTNLSQGVTDLSQE